MQTTSLRRQPGDNMWDEVDRTGGWVDQMVSLWEQGAIKRKIARTFPFDDARTSAIVDDISRDGAAARKSGKPISSRTTQWDDRFAQIAAIRRGLGEWVNSTLSGSSMFLARSACADRGHPLTRQPLDGSKSDRSPARACPLDDKAGVQKGRLRLIELAMVTAVPTSKRPFWSFAASRLARRGRTVIEDRPGL